MTQDIPIRGQLDSENIGQKTALVHIGTPKTGTTSIQMALAEAVGWPGSPSRLLPRSGDLAPVRYPLFEGDHNHRRMVVLYQSYEELSRSIRSEYPAKNERFERMRREYRSFLFSQLSQPESAILSAEGLSTFEPRHAARLRDDLESLGFKRFHIVLYIRDPADYYLSVVQQRLKSPAEPPFVSDPETFEYQFLRIARTWEETFPGGLVVRKFPTGTEHDIVDDFASLLMSLLKLSVPSCRARMNASLSAEAMQILQDYRLEFWPDNDGFTTPDTNALAAALQRFAGEVPQTTPRLKPIVAEQIRANHRSAAETIHSKYGVDLDLAAAGALKPDDPRAQSLRVEDIVESVDQVIAYQLLLRLAKTELSRPPVRRSLPFRIAARAYRSIPPARRPARLDSWLKAVVKSGR